MYVAGRENGDSEYSQARRDKVKHEGVSKLSLVLPFKILFGGSEVIPRKLCRRLSDIRRWKIIARIL